MVKVNNGWLKRVIFSIFFSIRYLIMYILYSVFLIRVIFGLLSMLIFMFLSCVMVFKFFFVRRKNVVLMEFLKICVIYVSYVSVIISSYRLFFFFLKNLGFLWLKNLKFAYKLVSGYVKRLLLRKVEFIFLWRNYCIGF